MQEKRGAALRRVAVESVTCAPYSEYAGALGWAVYTVDAWNRRDQSGQSGSVSRPSGPPGARDAAVIGRAAALGWGSGAGGRETVELRDPRGARARGGRAGSGYPQCFTASHPHKYDHEFIR